MKNLIILFLKQSFIYRSLAFSMMMSTCLVLTAFYLIGGYAENMIIASIIILPILAISNSLSEILYSDYERGNLEFYLVSYNSHAILISKIISVSILCFLVIFLNYLICVIFFGLQIQKIIMIIVPVVPFMLVCSSILILVGVIRIYFDKNTNILSIMVLPFILPELILIGMYIHSNEILYLSLLCGITLVILPITVIISNLLVKELYNS